MFGKESFKLGVLLAILLLSTLLLFSARGGRASLFMVGGLFFCSFWLFSGESISLEGHLEPACDRVLTPGRGSGLLRFVS